MVPAIMPCCYDIAGINHDIPEFKITATKGLNRHYVFAAGVLYYVPTLWMVTNLQHTFLGRVKIALLVAFA